MTDIWVSAIGLGFLGSLHCAAMCSPLAIAGCSKGDRVDAKDTAGYMIGRVATYSVVGALFGSLGHAHWLHEALGSIQSVATWLVAAIALAQGLKLLLPRRPTLVQIGAPKRSAIVRFFASLLPRRGLGLGLATGLLPCGMLMSAWMLAASSGSPQLGAAVMAGFALASFPALLFPLFTRRWVGLLTGRSPLLYGAAWCLLAVWIGARPLLGVMHHHH